MSSTMALAPALALLLALGGALAWGGTVWLRGRRKALEAEARSLSDRIREEAEQEKRQLLLAASEEAHRLRQDGEASLRQERTILQKLEVRMAEKEEQLASRSLQLVEKESLLRSRIEEQTEALAEIARLKEAQVHQLEQVAHLTVEEARGRLLGQLEEDLRSERARMIRDAETEARETSQQKARDIVATAINRYAADAVNELTVTVVQLPNDEMKGRIIGREGRNIRTLEALTGVGVIIDDTPEAVILSAFDPYRRAVAKVALERLIEDGRIHPARIEEMVERAERDMEERIRQEGEEACFQARVHNLHPELVRLLGKLRYRTSYGQNVLAHSQEVGQLAGMMAAELGADSQLARRAGLLHDIGKAMSHEVEGTHVEIGRGLLKKYQEADAVIRAMEAHHGEYQASSVEAVLVTAADTLSAARPGARREVLESYLQRLEKLEKIGDTLKGVEKSYAIQAGRELRILVRPEEVDENEMALLARDVARRIESEVEYPGQIKVTLIRESRIVEMAN